MILVRSTLLNLNWAVYIQKKELFSSDKYAQLLAEATPENVIQQTNMRRQYQKKV